MYVCICNVLTDKQVAEVIADGVTDAHAVHPRLGCATRCGQCISTIADMMDAEVSMGDGAASIAAE